MLQYAVLLNCVTAIVDQYQVYFLFVIVIVGDLFVVNQQALSERGF